MVTLDPQIHKCMNNVNTLSFIDFFYEASLYTVNVHI